MVDQDLGGEGVFSAVSRVSIRINVIDG